MAHTAAGPRNTRFKKGQSGNPKGRPRKSPPAQGSAFDIILNERLTVTKNGIAEEVPVEDALLLKLYQDALAGKATAIRKILRMIEKREKWLAARRPATKPVVFKIEPDCRNADEALLLLGIASLDHQQNNETGKQHLSLAPWAVDLARKRLRSRSLPQSDQAEIRRCTRAIDDMKVST